MSPIPLGILAVAGSAPAGAYELISTQVLSGEVSSVTFSSIPQTYKHLQLRGVFERSGGDVFVARLNADSGFNYSWHRLYGEGSFVGSDAGPSESGMRLTVSGASRQSGIVCDVLDYSSTTKNTTFRSLAGFATFDRYINLSSGAWYSTAAVTTITLNTSATLIAGSRFSLYGIKG
jgi:hypothetical protein